jgi:hypothetical protein
MSTVPHTIPQATRPACKAAALSRPADLDVAAIMREVVVELPQRPGLQQLVARWGRYDLIPPEAWQEHYAAYAAWHEARRAELRDEQAKMMRGRK